MNLAAMQPYFFPYLGQFDLLNQADLWIAFDTAQYIRHGWVNRNRVLHASAGWQYAVVPVEKHSRTTPINQIVIADQADWKTRIFRQLYHYHMDAPYYAQVIRFLKESFAQPERNMARLNIDLFRSVSRQLGIETPIQVFSEMELSLEGANGPEKLALALCDAIGADGYINPPGGAHLYDARRFAEQGVALAIQTYTPMSYACGRYQFEPNMSVIDVMMWNSPAEIKHYLDTFRHHHESSGTHGRIAA